MQLDTEVGALSQALQGTTWALVGAGGIAAIELPKIAREMRRHGAKVRFYVTPKCLEFVGLKSLEWASEAPVTVEPSGFAEHICVEDSVLVLPATTNFIGQLAHGLAGNGATTLVQSALGQEKPVFILQTMHDSLAASPMVESNIEKLKKVKNISFLKPRLEEGKHKSPQPEDLVRDLCHLYNRRPEKVLVTMGGTSVSLDGVRTLSNSSSGNLGRQLCDILYRSGFQLTVYCANITVPPPQFTYLDFHKDCDYSEIYNTLEKLDTSGFTALYQTIAGSDFLPEQTQAGKISSSQDKVSFHMEKAKKLRDLENLKNIPFRVGCKLTDSFSSDDFQQVQKLLGQSFQAVLWNTASTSMGQSTQHVGEIHSSEKLLYKTSSKKEAALYLSQTLFNFLSDTRETP